MPDESSGHPSGPPGGEPRHRGAGDRWLEGEALPGVRFAAHDAVEVLIGRHEGERGVILLLVALDPEPAYFVEIAGGRRRLLQSALRPAD